MNHYTSGKSALVGMHLSIPGASGQRNNAALYQKWFTFYINRLIDDEIKGKQALCTDCHASVVYATDRAPQMTCVARSTQ